MSGQDLSRRSLLRISDLSIRFSETHAATNVVNSLNLTLYKGEIAGVVGESGSGKTMIARAIMQLLPPGARIESGSITFDESNLCDLTESQMREIRGARIGMIFQEPAMSMNPALKIGVQLAEGLRVHTDLADDEIREQCIRMLEKVRLNNPDQCLRRYPHEFSGGMLQRIMIASALLMQPELLIADEPTTALDVLIQKEIMDTLIEVSNDLGTTILLISHDLGLIASYAQHVAVMMQGNLIENGSVNDILLTPQSEYTRELLNSLPRRGSTSAPSRNVDTDSDLIEIRNLDVNFGNKSRLPWRKSIIVNAVINLSITLQKGRITAVVGESGSGKTTLGRAILGLVHTTNGEILLQGANIAGYTRKQMRPLRTRLQIVFQDPFSALDPRMRIWQIVGEGLRLNPTLTSTERRALVSETLTEVGLGEDYADRFPHELSGGQRQRICIARAIITRPMFIVADEPVSALDVTVQAQILKLLRRLQQKFGFTYLFVSHDLSVVEQIADLVVVMHRGRVLEVGTRDDIFDRPTHPYTCRLLEAVPSLRKLNTGGYELERRTISSPIPPDGLLYENHNALDDFPLTNGEGQLVQIGSDHRVAYCPSSSKTQALL